MLEQWSDLLLSQRWLILRKWSSYFGKNQIVGNFNLSLQIPELFWCNHDFPSDQACNARKRTFLISFRFRSKWCVMVTIITGKRLWRKVKREQRETEDVFQKSFVRIEQATAALVSYFCFSTRYIITTLLFSNHFHLGTGGGTKTDDFFGKVAKGGRGKFIRP